MHNRKEIMEIIAELEALKEAGKPYSLIGPRVALLRDEAPDKVGRLFVPDNAKTQMLSGTIVMLGNGLDITPEAREQYAGLRVGQWATFNKYNGVVHSIYLPVSGRKVAIEVMHALDLYIVWEGESDTSPFDEANHSTGGTGATGEVPADVAASLLHSSVGGVEEFRREVRAAGGLDALFKKEPGSNG